MNLFVIQNNILFEGDKCIKRVLGFGSIFIGFRDAFRFAQKNQG